MRTRFELVSCAGVWIANYPRREMAVERVPAAVNRQLRQWRSGTGGAAVGVFKRGNRYYVGWKGAEPRGAWSRLAGWQRGMISLLVVAVVVASLLLYALEGSDGACGTDALARIAPAAEARLRLDAAMRQAGGRHLGLSEAEHAVGREVNGCTDAECVEAPCATCWWTWWEYSKERWWKDSEKRTIEITVVRFGTPLTVRGGSRLLAVEYSW